MTSVISRTLDYDATGGQPPITEQEARGDSRPISREEFQKLSGLGAVMLTNRSHNSTPITALDARWPAIKAMAYTEVSKPWGGVTINAHTGQPLDAKIDAYAITVRPASIQTVAVPEGVSPERFGRAMNLARRVFRSILEREDHYLGVFHDNDTGLIDIDPVVVVATIGEVEAIGAYTHATGGAYHFATGEGFFPPHVAEPVSVAG